MNLRPPPGAGDAPEPHRLIAEDGYALLAPSALQSLAGVPLAALEPMRAGWNDLPPDRYLRDGGRYRFRRHASYTFDAGADRLQRVPHRAHWQPVSYNALHGGIERWFEPLADALDADPAFRALVTGLGRCFQRVRPATPWFVEAHQFRIDTSDGIGRPTPEGAHRDGVDFVAVLLIGRERVKGGETRVFEADGPSGVRFTMLEPWTALLIDDLRVIHETTPIQPTEGLGHRDTLVLTYRSGGFQDP